MKHRYGRLRYGSGPHPIDRDIIREILGEMADRMDEYRERRRAEKEKNTCNIENTSKPSNTSWYWPAQGYREPGGFYPADLEDE